MDAASTIEQLRAESATLRQLLDVHEEQASRQFDLIREQQRVLEHRTRELVASNDALGRAHAVLADVFTAMPGALLVTDLDGRVRVFNGAASTLLGMAPDELAGMPLGNVFDASDPLPLDEIRARGGRGEVLRVEKNLVSKGGERVPVLLSATVLHEETPATADASPSIVCVAIGIGDRKKLELELRQAQKLESVGRLAAGVAHEINTPVQFVSDSVHFVRDAMNDLLPVIGKYRELEQRVADGVATAECARAVADAEALADLAYLLEAMPKALERSLEGLGRVATIVRSMKEFAHPQSKEMTPIDLNRAIESTLVIARNEYKYVADVDAELGDIPLVTCHGGDVNQVILNILVNAAHAIAAAGEENQPKGRIGVRTLRDGDSVLVAISDTGTGIPDAIRERIFDPFFTTKPVGQGTGQGLAIARSVIVEKHGGDLTFETREGSGTTFTIRLPIDGKRPQPHRGAR